MCMYIQEKHSIYRIQCYPQFSASTGGLGKYPWRITGELLYSLPGAVLCLVMSDFATLGAVAQKAPLSMGILQARIMECIAMPFSRGCSQCRDQTQVSHIAGGFFTI